MSSLSQVLPATGGSSVGTIKTLTGNSGGAVGPDGSGNINVVGDTIFLQAVGTPGINTVTVSPAQPLVKNINGSVPDSSGDFNINGGPHVSIIPGTNEIEIDVTQSLQNSFAINNWATAFGLPSAQNNLILGRILTPVSSTGATDTYVMRLSTDGGSTFISTGYVNIGSAEATGFLIYASDGTTFRQEASFTINLYGPTIQNFFKAATLVVGVNETSLSGTGSTNYSINPNVPSINVNAIGFFTNGTGGDPAIKATFYTYN